MKLREKGVLPESNIYFHTPKENNRKVLLTPKSCGYFFCDDNYKVMRDKYSGYFHQNDSFTEKEYHYGSYMCLFVKTGKGYVYQNDRSIVMNKNDVFLLDCYHPHIYGTFSGSKMEILWIHFDGPMIRSSFKQIADNMNCFVLKNISPIRAQTIYNNL